MTRIAAALLIALAVVACNGALLGGAFAKDVVAAPVQAQPPIADASVPKSTKLLSLLMVLESLRQAPVSFEAPKV